MSATRQLAWRHCRDMRIEVRRIEREHVGPELESRHRSSCELQLRILQLKIVRLRGQPMKFLPRKRLGRKTRYARNRPSKKRAQMTLPRRRARSLHRHREQRLTQRHAL